jgi:peptidoglycan/LPS O-acetylase OafA/YrhL
MRIRSLDGLRGVAALQVVFFHAMLVAPPLADLVRNGASPLLWVEIVSFTPLRLLWAGQEAVVIFFVLSGTVLTLPFLHRRFDAVTFYPRRLLRIYVPVWGSVLLALLWRRLVPRVSSPGASWWVNAHDFHLSVMGFGGDMTLVVGTTWLNSVLWSLKWEIWFSLLLPLYLLALVRHRRWPLLKLVLLLALVQVGDLTGHDSLRYLPVFGVGVVVAVELGRIESWVSALGRRTWVALALVLVLLLGSRWVTGSFLSAPTVLGAAAVVALFASWEPAVRLGEHRWVRWLGLVSFSLYLVHEPVVTSVALLLRTTDPLLVLGVSAPVSLVLAFLFYRCVERPAHLLARRVGQQAQSLQVRSRTRRAGTPT